MNMKIINGVFCIIFSSVVGLQNLMWILHLLHLSIWPTSMLYTTLSSSTLYEVLRGNHSNVLIYLWLEVLYAVGKASFLYQADT